MSKYTILCFTGTGNSRYIAKKLAAALNCDLTDLNNKIKNNDLGAVDCAENLIFVTPTYCWRIPRLVEQWAKKVSLNGAARVWFVMDCGDGIGNAAKYNRVFAGDIGLEYMGTFKIVMPENYIAMFNVPDEREAKEIVAAAQPLIDSAASQIAAGRKFVDEWASLAGIIESGPVNPLFYRFSVKADAFKVGETCLGCGECAQLCPLNNIKLTEGKPVWGDKCTHCMACICHCPTEAIEYGKKSQGKNRYHI